MDKKIHNVSSKEMEHIKKTIESDSSLFIAQIESGDVQRLQDFLNNMSEVFQFPIPSRSIDSYNDWMRDLEWLNKDGYVLIINNYKDFFSQDIPSKKVVIDSFNDIILPFWEEKVTKVVVEGKKKTFMVYLVD